MNEKQLENKVALVTGASKGIGYAIARTFAFEGAQVWMTARSEDELQTSAQSLRDEGGQVVPVAGDVTDEEFVQQLFARIREECGRLDILVNNAGMAVFGLVEEMTVTDFRRCLELDVVAVFSCTQQAVRLMKENGDVGKIINIGSVRSHWSEAGDGGAYNAAKYGLRGMTESIARQLHGSGSKIAVGSVCPGVVDTSLTNPRGEERPDWLTGQTVAAAVLHAVTAPEGVNIFDTTLIPMSQKPW